MMISELYPRVLLDDGSPSPGGGSPAPAPSTSPGGPPSGAGAAPQTPQTVKSSIQEDRSPEPPSGDSFAGMDDDLDTIDLGVQPPPTGDEPGAAAAPDVRREEQQAAPEAKPSAPQAAPAAPAQQGTSAAPRSQLDSAIEGFQSNYHELAQWASQNLFALSKEDAEALETNAVEAIPKLMGRVYTSALQAATNLIKNFVPEMVNSGAAQQQMRSARAAEALQEFYQTNPHLNVQQHGAAVDKWARAFRGANPSASRAEAIAFVGRAVSAEFGLSPGSGGRKAAPFAPARPGARAPARTGEPHDPYAGMEDEYD